MKLLRLLNIYSKFSTPSTTFMSHDDSNVIRCSIELYRCLEKECSINSVVKWRTHNNNSLAWNHNSQNNNNCRKYTKLHTTWNNATVSRLMWKTAWLPLCTRTVHMFNHEAHYSFHYHSQWKETGRKYTYWTHLQSLYSKHNYLCSSEIHQEIAQATYKNACGKE